jgi:hypothetical protein
MHRDELARLEIGEHDLHFFSLVYGVCGHSFLWLRVHLSAGCIRRRSSVVGFSIRRIRGDRSAIGGQFTRPVMQPPE